MQNNKSSNSSINYILNVATIGINQLLSYASNDKKISIGHQVTADIGKRKQLAWVVETIVDQHEIETIINKLKANKNSNNTSSQLALFENKDSEQLAIKEINSSKWFFTEELLQCFKWISKYYGNPLAEVIESALPHYHPPKTESFFTLNQINNEEFQKILQKNNKQTKILKLLEENGELNLNQIEKEIPSARASLTSLSKKQLIKKFEKIKTQSIEFKNYPTATDHILNKEQQEAFDSIKKSIDEKLFSPILIHGVTGSGKTEIYLKSIKEVVNKGGSALVIVPEIALTPQLFDYFESRLGIPVGLLHSKVKPHKRYEDWNNILEGKIRVAIGARSAVFAPLKNLSLVIVDEEHESSYKQSENLRYNAKDVAMVRAKNSNCPIVLGSATPCFESLLNAHTGKFKLIEINSRATKNPLPQIEIIDLSKIKRASLPSPNLSPKLYDEIKSCLTNKEQCVILYNKRGFANYLQCETCNEVVSCPNCSVSLTFHKGKNRLVCHYCLYSETTKTHCPKCRNPNISKIEIRKEHNTEKQLEKLNKVGELKLHGGGTEKVIDELVELFPNANIIRMDRDSVTKHDAHREIINQMKSGKADILVGTQMIAKGHDIPGVTLVGIIDADVGLSIPDFRASEKSYQLITQASGRAGRGEIPGKVIIQTRQINHPVIVALSNSRFKAFARYELDFRKKLNYPPFSKLLRIIISSTSQSELANGNTLCKNALEKIIQELKARSDISIQVLGPAPAPLEKLRGRYRSNFIIKSNKSFAISAIASTINQWKKEIKGFKDLRIITDIDPQDML